MFIRILVTIAICCGAGLALPMLVGKNETCKTYANACTQNEECCNCPLVLCLPDVFNNKSCLSPMDILNLDAAFTSSDMIRPLLETLGNATLALVDVVQIDGETVYNKTEIVTSASAPSAEAANQTTTTTETPTTIPAEMTTTSA